MLIYRYIQSTAHRITFWCCIAVQGSKNCN